MSTVLTLLHIGVIVSLSYRIWRRKDAVLKRFFWPALILKLVAGVCLGLVYTYYYTVADTFVYFEDGEKLASLAHSDLGAYVNHLTGGKKPEALALSFHEPRARFLAKITSVFCLITANNYWVTSLYFSFFSFLGAWFLVRTIAHRVQGAMTAALVAFLFLPSAVFWSSGVLKESLALGSLYFLSAIVIRIWFGERITLVNYLITAICLWMLWNLKYYYAAIFLPVSVTMLAYKYIVGERLSTSSGLSVLAWLGMFILPSLLVTFLHPNFNPERLLDVIMENYAAYQALSDPEDAVHFYRLRGDPLTFLLNSPWALFSGLFRPLPWETSALIQVPAAIENAIVLVFFAAACLQYKRYFSSPYLTPLLATTTYVVLLAILITFSAPNFGTLSRYRTGFNSFFVMLILAGNPLLKYMERSVRRLVSH